MAVPVVFGGLLMVAVLSLVILSQFEGCISGDRMRIELQSSCAEQASEVISERVEMMGLGEPQMQVEGDRITLDATFPGYSDSEDQTIPETLAATGDLVLISNGETVMRRAEINEVALDQDESGMPIVNLVLSEEAATRISAEIDAQPEGSMQFELDGEFVVTRPNSRQLNDLEIRVLVDHGKTELRMQQMADLNILLNTALMPCDVSVQSVSKAEQEPE
jgi:preprotein translocase subunit SecD